MRRPRAPPALRWSPERQSEKAKLVLRCDVPSAIVELDGVALEGCRSPSRSRPAIAGSAPRRPGGIATNRRCSIDPGEKTSLDVELPKNRSWVPLFLALGAAGSAGLGTGFWPGRQWCSPPIWSSGCPARTAVLRASRQSYEGDERSMNIRRASSAALFTLAGGLAIAAVVTYVINPGSEEEP